MKDEEQLRLYTVWSNFIYFITGLYSIIIAIFLQYQNRIKNSMIDSLLFTLYGIIIVCTGSFSVYYHHHTPSWTNDPETVHTEKYKHSLSLDVGFAYATIALSFAFLLYRAFCVKFEGTSLLHFWEDPNTYFSLMFMILSGVFYFLGGYYFDEATGKCVKKTEEEKAMACFEKKISAYDVFHSNWHIFASITGIFWLNMLKNSYFYTQ